MEHKKVVVIGAGVSGLSLAAKVDTSDYLIFEGESEIGGYCRTISKDGFTWDYSGHFFHFKHPEIEQELVARMSGQKVLVVERKSRVLSGDTIIDFPFQKNIHQLPQQEFIDCLYDLFTREEGESENFKDMLYKKFGRSIAEKFLVPYNEKLYATDLANLDVDAMGRFFPYANPDEIVRNFKAADNASYNSTFTYPEGGAIQYVHAIAADVSESSIALNEWVESIDLTKKVVKTSKREVSFDYLVSSTPMPKLLKMCGLPHQEDAFSWNKVLVFNLGFDKKGPTGMHWLYVPSRELCFYRVGFYDNIFDTDRMSIYVELGFPKDAVLDEARVEKEKQRVLEDLKKAGIASDHKLVSSHSVVLDPAYVHITKDSGRAVDQAKRTLAARGVFSIGRYGSWTYCSIEDNMVEARTLAKEINPLLALG